MRAGSAKKNKQATIADIPRVGPGTLAGEWLRRYWLVVGTAADLLLMFGLPLLYAVAAYLTLDLPARLFAGRAHFSSTGVGVFLASLGVSFLGLSRLLRGAPPVAPVRPKFARAMLLATWAAALLLTLADLAG